MEVSVHEAKTHLSRLLKAVEQGEQVVIERNGQAVAELVLPRATGRVHLGTGDAGELGCDIRDPAWWRSWTEEESDSFFESG
ncbi:MAG: type II toxin-antitoxin system prevent-host-death family antitoxin [Acidobacteriota bacterium]|nr:type II toxin-antitoxin system prevent-host-death family antitoxin [Acidobacteriota bacterium]